MLYTVKDLVNFREHNRNISNFTDARTRLSMDRCMSSVILLRLLLLGALSIGPSSALIVGTEPSVALQMGRPGSLPCIDHTGGNVDTVMWLKGQDCKTAEWLIMMEVYPAKGHKHGPGYVNGSCDIDDDFSLLIKEVNVENGGRYICQVTPGETGIVVSNYTDVTVYGPPSMVGTKPSVALQIGKPGSLPCIDHTGGYIYTVAWLKGQEWSTAESIVIMDTYAYEGHKYGPGYVNGSYDIDDDFSLLIKEVDVENGGRYICQVIPIETGIFASNHTEVTVYAEPHSPYPTILEPECLNADDGQRNCSITVSSSVELTCMVTGYYPSISLLFRNSAAIVPALESNEWENEDGSKSKYITILAVADNTTYQCVASSIPGPGHFRERVATIMLTKERITSYVDAFEKEASSSNIWKIAFYTLLLLCSVVLIAFLIYRLRQRGNKKQSDHVATESTHECPYEVKSVQSRTTESTGTLTNESTESEHSVMLP